MKDVGAVVVERMADLGDWELYRFADEETDDVVCKIALRPDGSDEVEYGVWRKEEAEPSATGSLDLEADEEWEDEAREHALRSIAKIYEEPLSMEKTKIFFQLDALGDLDQDEDQHDGDGSEDG